LLNEVEEIGSENNSKSIESRRKNKLSGILKQYCIVEQRVENASPMKDMMITSAKLDHPRVANLKFDWPNCSGRH